MDDVIISCSTKMICISVHCWIREGFLVGFTDIQCGLDLQGYTLIPLVLNSLEVS